MNKYSLVFIAIALFVVLSLQAQVKEASIEFRTCFDTESTEPAATVATCLSPYVWHHATFDVSDGEHQTKDGYELTAKGCTCVVHMDVTFENHDETHPTVANWCDTYGVYEWRAQDNTLLGSYTQSTQAEVAHGTNAYGCPIIYTLDLTVNQCAPLGAINGKFSVSANKQVYFSKGNLQFCAKPGSNPKNYTHLIFNNSFQQQSGTTTSGGQWRFAEHQYDYVGATTQLANGETNTGNVYVGGTQSSNSSRSSSYSGYIDIFTWGSSSVSMTPWSLTAGYASLYNIDCFDWGYYNSIYYGNNQSSAVSEWRTPKAAEMKYLLKDRHGSGWSANNRMAMGTIEGQNGLILLPDVWAQPAGVPFRDYTNSVATQLSTNVYTASTWQQMEDRGAVFLPCAGMYEWGWSTWGGFNKYGGYWLREYYSSYPSTSEAYYFEFRTTTGVNITNINTDSGRASVGNGKYTNYSVRLIQDVQ